MGSEAQLACLVEIMLVLVIKAVSMFYMGAADRERIMEVTRRQMYILKNGALSGNMPEESPAVRLDRRRKRRRLAMRDNRKRPGARRGLVVLTACVLAGITPVTAFAAKRPDDNLSDVEAPRPDVNKDLSPEFAYSEDKWAAAG